MSELRSVCNVDQETLNYIFKNLSKYYRTKKEEKFGEDGTQRRDSQGKLLFRTLTPSKGRIKFIQGCLNAHFQKVKFPESVHGSIKGKDYISNALAHVGNNSFFCTDLKDFFPGITCDKVFKALRKLRYPAHVASLITKLTTYENKLPQGAPTSSIISNIVMWEVDKELIEYCNRNKLVYTRYIDDITISAKHKVAQAHIDYAINVLAKSGFKISRAKTYLKHGSAEITGCMARKRGISATKKLWKKLQDPKRSNSSKKGVQVAIDRIRKTNAISLQRPHKKSGASSS